MQVSIIVARAAGEKDTESAQLCQGHGIAMHCCLFIDQSLHVPVEVVAIQKVNVLA